MFRRIRGHSPAADGPRPSFVGGDAVRTVRAIEGMPRGSAGIVVGRYTNEPELVVVRFWDGGPLKVRADALTRVEAH